MQPVDVQTIGHELAVKWADGTESFIRLEHLRRACPCAGCRGEVDIMGNLYKNPDRPYAPTAFQLKRLVPVGNYALNFVWADGHNAGIYAFDYLKRIAAAASK